MKRYAIVSLLVLLLILTGVRTEQTVAFVNGRIITMDASSSVVEAMLVEDGRISELGSTQEISSNLSDTVRVIDLNGRTMVPGFVDAHSHFPASGIRAVSVDLSPPPTGITDSVKNLLEQIASATDLSNDQDWLLGFNYDNTALDNGEHPTREQLDSVAPDHPVYLWHNSGHMGVANSRALSLLAIDEDSKPPPGGVIARDSETGRLTGLLQETAAPPLSSIVSQFSLRRQLRILTAARDAYLAQGVTTVQNGYTGLSMMRVLRFAQRLGVIPQRVIVWPAHGKKNIASKFSGKHDEDNATNASFNYRTGAIKILVDGSPQGMTAYLSEPYFRPMNKIAGYRGFALIDQLELTKLVTQYHSNGYQLALHGNGDEAIESIIDAVEIAQRVHPRSDARHIIVHAQTIRRDQLARLHALSLTPSFFTSHTFFWGDWHRQQSLGPDRAADISPAAWADEFDIRYSFHTDAPVTPMHPMQLLWSASQRKTSSGYELGVHQRIDIESALRAITINAAWQNHVDNEVGSLEVGKLADMVVLSHNPFTIEDVRKIKVLTTYIEGVKRYSLSEGLTETQSVAPITVH